jgi:hypothetical protein
MAVGMRQDGWAKGFLNEHIPFVWTVGRLRIEFAVNQVARGRLNMFVYAEKGVSAFLRRMNLDPANYEVVHIMDSASPYFGFHRDVPEKALEMFHRSLDAVRDSPQYRELEEKYFN